MYVNVIDNRDTLSLLLFLYKMDISLVCYNKFSCLSSLRKPLVISIVIQLVDRMVDLRLSWGEGVLVLHFLFLYDTILFC